MPLSITSLSGDNLSACPNKDWVEQVRNLAAQCTNAGPVPSWCRSGSRPASSRSPKRPPSPDPRSW